MPSTARSDSSTSTRPPRRASAKGDAVVFTKAKRIHFLKRYGAHCNAFASFQPDMRYFDLHGIGFIPYHYVLGLVFVLSDPICKADDVEALVASFLVRFKNAIWIQITPQLAEHLAEQHGLYATQIGSENKVALSSWTMAGQDRRSLRKTVNQAKTQGIDITEEDYICPKDAQHAELIHASNNWLKTRIVKKELKFFVRPMAMEYRENCRYFYARKEGRIVGYICFDPIYRAGKVIAYAPNVSRSCASFKRGIWYTIMVHAITKMKEEGIAHIDLGFVPAHVSKEIESSESPLVHKLMELIYHRCGWLYSCQGLHFAKARFDGTFTKTFLAHRSRMPLLSILVILRSSGVI